MSFVVEVTDSFGARSRPLPSCDDESGVFCSVCD